MTTRAPLSGTSTPTIHAPDFLANGEGKPTWLNTTKPLSIKDLKGQVVILDFWTSCCVNCLHVLPVLQRIERRFASEPVVVIGIHSAKFTAEKDKNQINDAIRKYNIKHPVVLDNDMSIWNAYAIRSWPTLVVIRPDGVISAIAPGEPDEQKLNVLIKEELKKGKSAGLIRPRLNIPTGTSEIAADAGLRYPGKISLLPDSRIVISDSGHHRILVTNKDGLVLHTIGSGLTGFDDGSFEDCTFNDPQGTCWFEDSLYVADSKNHALRKIDFKTETVLTVAGNGKLGSSELNLKQTSRQMSLRSPWALTCDRETIYVAMAGSHQIWKYVPGTGELAPYAGSGEEALVDARLEDSKWAQPSGLFYYESQIFVADSESSSVRKIDIKSESVTTLIGKGLFDFGDAEGDSSQTLLQHNLDVAAFEDQVYIADTFNGKIKVLDLKTNKVKTIIKDLNEPSGLTVDKNGKLFVVDTNHHRILTYDQEKVQPLSLQAVPTARKGYSQEVKSDQSEIDNPSGWFSNFLSCQETDGFDFGENKIILRMTSGINWILPKDTVVKSKFEISRRSDLVHLKSSSFTLKIAEESKSFDVEIPIKVDEFNDPVIDAEILVTTEYAACNQLGFCSPGSISIRVPIRLIQGSSQKVSSFEVDLPEY